MVNPCTHIFIYIGLIDTEGTTKALVSASALQLFCCARLLLYMRTSAYYQFCANERRVHEANAAAAAHAHEPRGRAKSRAEKTLFCSAAADKRATQLSVCA
jgi:hypothetical protein